jgi:hypothetical protein
MRVKPVIILASLLGGFTAKAQRPASGNDTVLKGSTIEVIQSYKPRVKQSPKPEWKPLLPPLDTTRPVFRTEVPQQTLYYTYNSPPLRPLALGKNDKELPYPNYVKAGGGNLSTIYMDAGIGSIKGKDYETGIHLHHISQKGKIVQQQTSLSGLEAAMSKHTSTADYNGSVTAYHNRYFYYGYDHVLYNYDNKTVGQNYTSVQLAGDMTNKKDTATRLEYHPGVRASYYAARFNTSEIGLGFNAPISYKLNKNLGLRLNVEGALASYKADSITAGNNYVMAAPGLAVQFNEYYSAHALAGFAYGKGGSTYFLPDAEVAFTMKDYLFRLSLGWKADLRQNTYEQLTTENPYMLNTYQVIQSRRDELFAAVQGSLGNHFAYSARGSWWNYFDLPTYLNDTGDARSFHVNYQNTKAISLQASARYHEGNKWSAGLTGAWYGFFKSTEQFVWHTPNISFKGDFMMAVTPKLDVTAYGNVLGGIHARDVKGNAVTLKTIADLGVGAEYKLIPRLSAFVQFNNLLNSKYQRWMGYQVYGFNIYGGVRLKF